MRNYRVSYPLLYTFLVLAVLSVASLVVFVGTYGKVLYAAHQARLLSSENAKLLERNAQIDSLRTELVRLQTMGIQIKKMLGVGLSVEDSILVASLSPIVNSPAISAVGEQAEDTRSEQQLLLKAIPSLWPVKGYVTRELYTTGGEKSHGYHPGMDIAARRNTPVQTSAEGVVVVSDWDDTYGYMIVIDHGFGISTLYGHNARNLVNVGERVTRGQTIAFVGSTGKSTAPHLHFEVKKNGVPVDPRNYLLN
ncbi:MAG: M23 family metallopeptidase [Candidatus Krumholzibacteria bacterium]|nr:M23 family metallopeptidase [Candidatus Krumholzibacteria bacterium]